MKRKDAAFAANQFLICETGRTNINVSRKRGSISKKLQKPIERQYFMRNYARLLLLIAVKKLGDLLEVAKPEASINLLKKAKEQWGC